MSIEDEARREGKGAFWAGRASPLATIAQDLIAVVASLEADWIEGHRIRLETAHRLHEIFNRARQIASAVE
jgi:hypothetical protein